MRIEIAKLHQRLGTTIIYVTHDQTEAMTLGTRIVVMKDGVVQQVDTPQNLYDKPQNLFVAGFMGSPQMNFLDTVVRVKGNEASLEVAGQSIPLPPAKAKKLIDGGYNGKTVVMGIRPEDVYDSEMFIETAKCVFSSTIKVYELLGAEVFLYFDLGDFPITARVDSRTTARPGDSVRFAFDVEKIHVFDKEDRAGYHELRMKIGGALSAPPNEKDFTVYGIVISTMPFFSYDRKFHFLSYEKRRSAEDAHSREKSNVLPDGNRARRECAPRRTLFQLRLQGEKPSVRCSPHCRANQ